MYPQAYTEWKAALNWSWQSVECRESWDGVFLQHLLHADCFFTSPVTWEKLVPVAAPWHQEPGGSRAGMEQSGVAGLSQPDLGELSGDRNLLWSTRAEALSVSISSTNTAHESLMVLLPFAVLSRRCQESFQGVTGMWQPSVHSNVAFWSFHICSSIIGSRIHQALDCWPVIGDVSWG